MKPKRIAALLLSGILLCADCSSALAMAGSSVSDMIREAAPLSHTGGKASPSEADEEPVKSGDQADAGISNAGTDEIWLENDLDNQLATPSDQGKNLRGKIQTKIQGKLQTPN